MLSGGFYPEIEAGRAPRIHYTPTRGAPMRVANNDEARRRAAISTLRLFNNTQRTRHTHRLLANPRQTTCLGLAVQTVVSARTRPAAGKQTNRQAGATWMCGAAGGVAARPCTAPDGAPGSWAGPQVELTTSASNSWPSAGKQIEFADRQRHYARAWPSTRLSGSSIAAKLNFKLTAGQWGRPRRAAPKYGQRIKNKLINVRALLISRRAMGPGARWPASGPPGSGARRQPAKWGPGQCLSHPGLSLGLGRRQVSRGHQAERTRPVSRTGTRPEGHNWRARPDLYNQAGVWAAPVAFGLLPARARENSRAST